MQACVSSRCRNEVRKSFASVARPTIEQALDVFEARHWIHAAVVRRLIDTRTPEKLARRRYAPPKAAKAWPTQGDVKQSWSLRRSLTKACARRLARWARLEHLAGGLRNAEPATHAGVGVRAWSGAAGGDRTHDPRLRRPILYPLSYSRAEPCILAACSGSPGPAIGARYNRGLSADARRALPEGLEGPPATPLRTP